MIKMMIIDGFMTIIAKVINPEEDNPNEFYEIQDPFILNLGRDQQGRFTYTDVIPLVVTNKTYVYKLEKSKVVVRPFDPPEQLENFYISLTGQIQVPKSSIII